MITVYEVMIQEQKETLAEITRRWGEIKFSPSKDPEDDPNFNFFNKLMRQVPRKGRG